MQKRTYSTSEIIESKNPESQLPHEATFDSATYHANSCTLQKTANRPHNLYGNLYRTQVQHLRTIYENELSEICRPSTFQRLSHVFYREFICNSLSFSKINQSTRKIIKIESKNFVV